MRPPILGHEEEFLGIGVDKKPQVPRVPSGRNSRVGEIFFRGKNTEFQFCLKQRIFKRTENGPSSAGFTGKSGIFWLPPRHNKQRDRHERSDSCYLVPYLSFKQKTSPLDTAFSRNIASKLRIFHCICRVKVWRFTSIFNLKK